jgi:hypothetical protein
MESFVLGSSNQYTLVRTLAKSILVVENETNVNVHYTVDDDSHSLPSLITFLRKIYISAIMGLLCFLSKRFPKCFPTEFLHTSELHALLFALYLIETLVLAYTRLFPRNVHYFVIFFIIYLLIFYNLLKILKESN